MALTTDLPVWDDCPWRVHVPAWITIRRGPIEGRATVVLDTPGSLYHVWLDAEHEPSDEALRHAVHCLDARFFNDELANATDLEEIRALALRKVKAGEPLL